MEILTLLKANIHYKKGSFRSIIILMSIISMALTLILSVQDNIKESIIAAQERVNTGTVLCMINKNRLSDKLYASIKNHNLVNSTRKVETIVAENVNLNGKDSSNSVFLQELREDYKLFNEKGTAYYDKVKELNSGELYISKGMQSNYSLEIGNTITINFLDQVYKFKVSGIIEDPELGASVIGWKNIFISHEDYLKLKTQDALYSLSKPGENKSALVDQLYIYKMDECYLTDGRFARQINLDTGILDMCYGTITKETLINYTYLFPKIICLILTVFVVFLMIVVLVIMCHSVSTGIEMEYTAIGIMKSLGFSKGKIRIVLASQYVLAQIIGAVTGILPAIILCRFLSQVFVPITGIIPTNSVAAGKCSFFIIGMILISVLCMYVITGKIAKVSPVIAISGGNNEIYFDSRIKAPVSKKILLPSLAFRQFTSNKRQYAGAIVSVSILAFFMTTMMVLANVITATSAWESMGVLYSDIDCKFIQNIDRDDKIVEEIKSIVEEYSAVEDYFYLDSHMYFSINGEQLMATIYGEPEQIKALTKGRIPIYDNEIVITEIAADNMGLNVGDRVTVAYGDKKAEYIISGLNQYMNDAGKNFSISMDAAEKIYSAKIFWIAYTIEDRSKGKAIEEALNERYGDKMNALFTEELMDKEYSMAIKFMTLIVYVFSIVFSVVVVYMFCCKAFIRERRDIGIFKALGFTSLKLRLQFAFRFSIVAVIGSVIGVALAAVFSGKLLSSILRLIGISSFKVIFNIRTFMVPTAVICICFFMFSLWATKKIKKVEVKELVVE